MTQEECPFRSSRVLHDDKGEFHLCNREGGDCECIPSGCPYLIAKNSKLNLPDLPGYVQIDDEQGVCIDSLQVQESCKENTDSFTDDLDAEIEMQWDSFNKHLADYDGESEEVVWLNWNSFKDVACYFYELGKQSKEPVSHDSEEAAKEFKNFKNK